MLATGGLIYMEAPSAGILYLYALRANTGAVQWKFPAAGIASLAVDAGIVYLNIDGIFYGLRASDGHILWHHAITFPDIVYEGDAALYIYQNQSGTLIALSGSDGTQRWSARIPALITIDTKEGIPEYGYEHMQSIDGVLYLVSYQGITRALREESGTLLWQTSAAAAALPSSNLFGAAPLSLSHDLLYVFTDQLYALSASNGHVLWQHSTQSANVILAGGSLYASYSGYEGTSCYAARDSQLEKFQSDTGTRLWRFQLAA